MILTLLWLLAFAAFLAIPVCVAYYLHVHEHTENDPLGDWIGRTERWEGEE